MSNPESSGEGNEATRGWSTSQVVHIVVLGLLVLGGVAYWALTPHSLNPMADPRAAEALALVQTHRARSAPTVLQAVTNRVKTLKERGQGVRLGEWRVQREGDAPDRYLVRIFIREQGTKDWFERDYVWRVRLSTKSVEAVSMPAEDFLPLTPSEPGPPVPAM